MAGNNRTVTYVWQIRLLFLPIFYMNGNEMLMSPKMESKLQLRPYTAMSL